MNAFKNPRDAAYAIATIIQRKTAILRINVKTTIGPSIASPAVIEMTVKKARTKFVSWLTTKETDQTPRTLQ